MSKKFTQFLEAASLAMCIFSGSVFAHDASSTKTNNRTVGISYAPVAALFGAHSLQLEYKANEIIAPVAGLSVIDNRWSIKPTFNNQPGTFVELKLGARFFATGSPLDHGLFVESSFFAFYGRTPGGTEITLPYTAGPNQWGLGALVEFGYEYVTDFGLSIDAGLEWIGYVGFGFPNSGEYNLSMWKPAVTGRVGYAW